MYFMVYNIYKHYVYIYMNILCIHIHIYIYIFQRIGFHNVGTIKFSRAGPQTESSRAEPDAAVQRYSFFFFRETSVLFLRPFNRLVEAYLDFWK